MANLISPAALLDLMASDVPCACIDVREPGEYNSSHIPGVSLLPRRQLEFDVPQAVPFTGTRVVVCDDDERRAALAAATLEGMGYGNVAVLEGGINRWVSDSHPTEWGTNVPSKDFGEKVEVVHHVPEIEATDLRARMARVPLLDAPIRVAPHLAKGDPGAGVHGESGQHERGRQLRRHTGRKPCRDLRPVQREFRPLEQSGGDRGEEREGRNERDEHPLQQPVGARQENPRAQDCEEDRPHACTSVPEDIRESQLRDLCGASENGPGIDEDKQHGCHPDPREPVHRGPGTSPGPR